MNSGESFIGGSWVEGEGVEFASLEPASGNSLWIGNEASLAQVTAAVDAARSAGSEWRSTSLEIRVSLLERYRQLLTSRIGELSATIAQEVGKPQWEAATEVAAMIGKLKISIAAQLERAGTSSGEVPVGQRRLTHHAHGVMAVFGPFNFPGHLPNGHIIPALLAGNTVVFKPSEQTPAVAEFMVRCWDASGLPAGVLNMVQGSAETGKALAAAKIDGLLFTGSAKTGKALHAQFGGRPEIMLALELGGNNPLMIHEPANVKGAIYAAIQSSFLTAGQRCTAASRILLREGSLGDEILDGFVAATERIVVGYPDDDPAPFMGPVISERAARAVHDFAYHVEGLGGKVLAGPGELVEGTGFVLPTIIEATGVSLPDEELFGPVVTVQRYGTLAEGIAMANDTEFGLSASLLTEDEADWETFSSEIRAGIVNWNLPTNGASSAAPFGGIGASGNHRASAYYAADYCAFPMASMMASELVEPESLAAGIVL